MHAACLWFTQNNTCFSIKTYFLKNRRAILSFRRDFADTNFIANYFDWLCTFDDCTAKKTNEKIESKEAKTMRKTKQTKFEIDLLNRKTFPWILLSYSCSSSLTHKPLSISFSFHWTFIDYFAIHFRPSMQLILCFNEITWATRRDQVSKVLTLNRRDFIA